MSQSFFFVVASKIGDFANQFLDTVLQCCPTILVRFSQLDAHFSCRFPEFGRGGGNFFEKKQNKSCCFQNVFNFLAANFLLAAGIFRFSRQFSVCFQIFHFIPINYNKEDFHYEHHYRHRPRLLRHQDGALLIPGRAYKLRWTRTLRLLIFHYLSVSYSRFKRQISDKPQVTVLWKCIKLQYIAQNGKKTPCIWYWNQIRGCCDILLFILPAAVSRLHRNGSSALIPPAGRILSRPSPQSTHGWTRYAHCCKIYLVQMKSNIQCDFECDFLLYLRTLPFNLTV